MLFVIKQLLELREVRGQVQVLVKWMRFDEGENTWEPVTTILEDAPDLLPEFLDITSSALAFKVRAML
jgi:Chromo (CHRromatin Organisation MOdifier) domain